VEPATGKVYLFNPLVEVEAYITKWQFSLSSVNVPFSIAG
jgi:hypothetical protein